MAPCTLTSGWHRALILLVVLFIATATGKHLHVGSTTSITAACTQSASCYTLQQLLQHSSHYFLSHTIITFQSGYHKLSYSHNTLVRNVKNITLLGITLTRRCKFNAQLGAFGLSLVNVNNLTVSNLNFYLYVEHPYLCITSQ